MYSKTPISKAPPALQSQNYSLLREAGLAHIEKLANRLWTDYNAHDPGITLMELLAFAITDIGYRAALPIQDILAPHPDAPDEKAFHTAREVLTCNPVTPQDYRKLLIDVDGVRNAWVIPTVLNTPQIFLDCLAEGLSFAQKDSNEENNTPVPLRGLYNVMLELDDEADFDDLNSSTLSMADLAITMEDSRDDTYSFEVNLWAEFKPWDEVRDFESIQRSLIECTVEYPAEVGPYEINIKININPEGTLSDKTVELEVVVRDTTYVERPTVAELEDDITEALSTYIGLTPVPEPGTLLYQYQKKIERIREVVADARDRMLAHRNLCEDVAAFKSLLVEEIGVCADVELRPEANSEAVLEEIFYQIANFLSPTIQFYSLSEMLDKGYTSEEIFEGPALEFGFIDDEELERADRRKVIHVSDLIQIIMDVEGVLAVRTITIANFPVYNPNNEIDETTAAWCLKLALEKDYVPRLTTRRSTINFFKDDLPIFFNQEQAIAKFDARQLADRQKPADPDRDFVPPEGQYRKLEEYYSIQEQLPQTYGVGSIGLPSTATDQRKAQAKQLQGYLLFFEQLIAAYFQQLAHIRDLFSMRSGVVRTYHSEPLTSKQAPGISHLVADFIQAHGSTPAEDLDGEYRSYLQGGNNFANDLQALFESDGEFLNRRNRFLNHLLARFNENFTDYALLLFGNQGNRPETDLISDKIDFLRDYPLLSANRGRAYHYGRPDDLWDTDNTTGLQIRLCRMLGLDQYERRTLSYRRYDNIRYTKHEENWRWELIDPDTGELLLHVYLFEGENLETSVNNTLTTFQAATAAGKNGILRKYSRSSWHSYRIYMPNPEGDVRKIGGTAEQWNNRADRDAVRNRAMELLGDISPSPQWFSEPGMHIVEHNLLRPKTPEGNLMDVCVDHDCDCQTNEEPYTFRISVILPAEADKFNNMDFRRYVDRRIRLETPAHILPKVCWISSEQMGLFEEAYREWLEAYAQASVELDSLYQNKNLLTVFNGLVDEIDETFDKITVGEEYIASIAGELLSILKLEQMEQDLREATNVNLDKAIAHDDLTRLEEIITEDEGSYATELQACEAEEAPAEAEAVSLGELLERVLCAINREFLDVVNGPLEGAPNYANLYIYTFGLLEAEMIILTGKVSEELEPEALFRELVDFQYRAYYHTILERTANAADAFLSLPEEELILEESTDENKERNLIMLNLRTRVQEARYYIVRYFLSWKLNRLLAVLESLRNVYPAAVLHDCDDDDGETPVMLGSTRLGSI